MKNGVSAPLPDSTAAACSLPGQAAAPPNDRAVTCRVLLVPKFSSMLPTAAFGVNGRLLKQNVLPTFATFASVMPGDECVSPTAPLAPTSANPSPRPRGPVGPRTPCGPRWPLRLFLAAFVSLPAEIVRLWMSLPRIVLFLI